MGFLKKEYFEKTRYIKKTTNLRNTFYEDIEIQDIVKKNCQIKRSLIIYHNFIISISRRL